MLYFIAYSSIVSGLLLYLFLTDLEFILLLLFLLESFSSCIQSATLANRLSINLIGGSLLTQLLSIAITLLISGIYIVSLILIGLITTIIYSIEAFNCCIQSPIFPFLSIEYLVLYLFSTFIYLLFTYYF